MINGKKLKGPTRAGTFRKITRRFAHNDRITLLLPMKVKLTHTPRGGVGIERGPLVYSLLIPAKRQIDRSEKRSTREFPAYDLHPLGKWNYALAVDRGKLSSSVEVVVNACTGEPWCPETTPIQLRVPARLVRGWRLERRKRIVREYWGPPYERIKGDFTFTPSLPDPKTLKGRLGKRIETITLVPYGCTQLRMTIFPHCS